METGWNEIPTDARQEVASGTGLPVHLQWCSDWVDGLEADVRDDGLGGIVVVRRCCGAGIEAMV